MKYRSLFNIDHNFKLCLLTYI